MSTQQTGKPATLPAGVVSLQGRAYSTWANTLDTAHDMNTAPLVRFLGITTTIVQLPTSENGSVAVVHATVTWRNAEGDTVQFQGIGDANPTNCGPVGKSALLRMAEVRAKGRALRDSVNIGQVLEEELSGDDDTPPAPAQRQPAQRTVTVHEPTGTQRPAPTALRTANTATEQDYAAVTRLLDADPEGAAKLPKAANAMTPEELLKTRRWLEARAKAIAKGQTTWVDPQKPLRVAGWDGVGDMAPEALEALRTLILNLLDQDPDMQGIYAAKGITVAEMDEDEAAREFALLKERAERRAQMAVPS